jgi:hypothetical protein
MRCAPILGPLGTALIVATAGCAAGATASDPEQLRALERERVRSLVAADTAAAGRLHASDFQLINPLGGSLSRADYLGAIASGVLDYRVWEPDSITVRMHDDVALLRYSSTLEVVFQGQLIPLQRYWHTDAYEKRDGGWKVVWSHATLMQSVPGVATPGESPQP